MSAHAHLLEVIVELCSSGEHIPLQNMSHSSPAYNAQVESEEALRKKFVFLLFSIEI